MKSSVHLFTALFFILAPSLVAQSSPAQTGQTSRQRAAWERAHAGGTQPASGAVSSSGLPAVSLSKAQVNFAKMQAVGTNSASEAVVVTNTGAGNLILSDIAITGDFLETDDCLAATIAPNATCTINVTFAPRALGQRAGGLTIMHNAAGGQQTIGLIGPALAPVFSTPRLTFDKQIVNTQSLSQSVIVSNPAVAGAVAIHITNIAVTAPFVHVDNNCLGTLAVGSQCSVVVAYKPTVLCGSDFGSLSLTDDQAGSPHSIALEGSGGAAAGGITTADLNSGLTPLNLATALVGTGVSISNVTYTGALQAAGTFTGGNGIIGFNQGIILSSGGISNVIGPNCFTDVTRDNGLPGDPDLTALIAPNQTFDAAVLQFDFVPTNGNLTFQYVFSSDEYNEFVSTGTGGINDVFGFFVNGVNAALIPGTTQFVSINNVNGGNPLGTNPQNPQFYINNDFQFPTVAPFNTEMDGLTVVLSVQTPVNAGVTNHIKLAIADGADHILDSNVFIRAGSISSPTLTFSPDTVAFGKVGVNGTASMPVVLKNTGTGAVSLASIVPSATFGQMNNCPISPATLGAGQMCTITASFSPTTGGFVTGTITITDSAPDSPQVINLSGTGVTVTITPQSLMFPAQAVNTTSTSQTVVVKNVGTIALTVTSVTPSGDFGQTNNCVSSSPIPVNGTCTINITFTPTATGTRNGSVVIVDNSIGTPETITLTGIGSNFTLTVGPGSSTTVTVHPGDTAIFPLSLGGANGFSGTVTLTCTSPQTSITCSVTPSSIVISPGGPAIFGISVSTFCSWNAPRGTPGTMPLDGPRIIMIWCLTLALLLSVLVFGKNRRRLALALPLALLLLLPALSCGKSLAGPGGATPPGLYNLLITATSGGQSQTLQLTLKVI